MKKIMKLTVLVTVMALGIMPALADTLVLKSGERVSGFFEGGSARVLKFRLADGSVKDYDILSIQTVQFGDEKATTVTAAPKTTTSSDYVKPTPSNVSPSGMPQL